MIAREIKITIFWWLGFLDFKKAKSPIQLCVIAQLFSLVGVTKSLNRLKVIYIYRSAEALHEKTTLDLELKYDDVMLSAWVVLNLWAYQVNDYPGPDVVMKICIWLCVSLFSRQYVCLLLVRWYLFKLGCFTGIDSHVPSAYGHMSQFSFIFFHFLHLITGASYLWFYYWCNLLKCFHKRICLWLKMCICFSSGGNAYIWSIITGAATVRKLHLRWLKFSRFYCLNSISS